MTRIDLLVICIRYQTLNCFFTPSLGGNLLYFPVTCTFPQTELYNEAFDIPSVGTG